MKNVVKSSKHFFGYFNTLETHSEVCTYENFYTNCSVNCGTSLVDLGKSIAKGQQSIHGLNEKSSRRSHKY